jgi:dUTP pyrophosphatase
VAPRSGLAWKSHIDVAAGVIDRDYTGNVGVVLFNHAETDLKVAPGDRICPTDPRAHRDVVEVESLDVTSRGDGGFGSTGASIKK